MAEAEEVCRRLSVSLSKPIPYRDVRFRSAASFGISEVTDKATTCDAALNAADAALYHAKSLGRGSVVTTSKMAAHGPQEDVPLVVAARR